MPFPHPCVCPRVCAWRDFAVNTDAHRCVRGRRACPEVMRRELGGLRMRARASNRCELRECAQHPGNYGLKPLLRGMETRCV